MNSKAKPLTAAEKKWIKQFKELMEQCPSQRLGAYTIGAHAICIYDATFNDEIDRLCADSDFCQAVESLNASLDTIPMPFAVHSTAG